jgi:hypothetical protein
MDNLILLYFIEAKKSLYLDYLSTTNRKKTISAHIDSIGTAGFALSWSK